jgi:hypothetical protein
MLTRFVIPLAFLLAATGTAQTPVPADTKMNRLVVTVANVSASHDAESLRVSVLRTPPGVVFHPEAVEAGALAHGQSNDVVLHFDTGRDVPLNRPDTVEIAIRSGVTLLWHSALSLVFTGPVAYQLDQNFPNPFNPRTTIRYALPERAHVRATVLNLLGQQVRLLLDEVQEAGYRSVQWDARNDAGGEVGSGVYVCSFLGRSAAGREFRQARKMLLVR